MKWIDFKKLMKNSDSKLSWDYEKKISKSKDLVEKNIAIWNKRRDDICEFYLSRKNPIKINNIPYDPNLNSERPSKIHLIFLLDSSGSMKGSRWNSLKDAVKKSYENCKHSNSILTSILTHDTYTKIRIQEQKPIPSLVENIPFEGTRTDFDRALNGAYDLIKSTCKKYDKFVICFVSDGDCSYPNSAINNIISDKLLFPKMSWYFISIEADMDLMNKMCTALKGKPVVEVKDLNKMGGSFVEIINDCTR